MLALAAPQRLQSSLPHSYARVLGSSRHPLVPLGACLSPRPQHRLVLAAGGESLYCTKLAASYAIVDGVPFLKTVIDTTMAHSDGNHNGGANDSSGAGTRS
jgi:hypothetical protein